MLKTLTMASISMGLWILFVPGIKPEEMIVGAISTVLPDAFYRHTHRDGLGVPQIHSTMAALAVLH